MSIRRTAFLWLAGLMTVTGIAVAIGSCLFVHNEVGELLDGQLRQIALYIGDTPSRLTLPPESDPHDPEDDFAIQVWDGSGRMLRESKPDVGIPIQAATGFSIVKTPVDAWRVYTLMGNDRIVQISQQMAVREELAADEAIRAIVPTVLLIPLSWILLGWVIGRIMRRTSVLAQMIAGRDASDTKALALSGVPEELKPFVVSINVLLQKVHDLIQQQRRFISDAAHELRTPLFAVQLQADNLRSLVEEKTGRVSRGAIGAGFDVLQQGIRRASDLVNQLLRLAHYDADPAVALAAAGRDLTDLVLAIVSRFEAIAATRGISLNLVRRDPVWVSTNDGDIETILSNLLDNALRYTPAAGRIEVSVHASAEQAVVEITDTGPGIDPEVLPKVFDRFFRAAPEDIQGSGLGLAIARVAAERNKASLTLSNCHPEPGLLAVLRLPAKPSGG